MKNVWIAVVLICAVATLIGSPASAATMATCNASFTQCLIPENIQLQLPFTGIAGDVKVVETDGVTLSDVFRISNNVINTGGGTGLGNLAFLFSADDGALPTTFSANVQTVTESASGFTTFNGNGTNYILGVPEPSTLALLSAAMVAIGGFAWIRRRRSLAAGPREF